MVYLRSSAWLYSSLGLWVVHLPRAAVPSSDGVKFGVADQGCHTTLAEAMGVPEAVVRSRMTGSRCYVGRVADRVAAYGWVSYDETPIEEIEATISLGQSEAYIWDCATLPEYRGQGYYTGLLRFILADLSSAGMQRAWIAHLSNNTPSRRGTQEAGFQPVLNIWYMRLLGLRHWWPRAVRGANTDMVRAARERLRFGVPTAP